MMSYEPIRIPDRAWHSESTRRALRQRDAGAILRVAQQYGASQHRLAIAVGILQGRVSEILNGNRRVTAFEVFERIADGLNMPDDARMSLGLAPRSSTGAGRVDHFGDVNHVFPSQTEAAADI